MRKGLFFVLLTTFVEALGFGIVFPNLPFLIIDVTGGNISSASLIGAVMILAFSVSMYFSAPYLTELSDRFGRRRILLSSLALFVGDFILLYSARSIIMLLLARVVAGVASATYSICASSIADLTDEENRGRGFGLLAAAAGAGWIVGPALGGSVGEYSIRLPFLIAAAIAAGNFVWGLFFFPETRRCSPDIGLGARDGDVERLTTGAFLRPLAISKRHWASLVLLLFVNNGLSGLWSYFTAAWMGWGKVTIGGSLALIGVLGVTSQLFILPRLIHWFGELALFRVSVTTYCLSLAILALTRNPPLFACGMMLSSLSGLAQPAITSYFSKGFSSDEQGRLQGSIARMTAIMSGVAPVALMGLFDVAGPRGGAAGYPAAPYAVSAGLMALVVAINIGKRTSKRDSQRRVWR